MFNHIYEVYHNNQHRRYLQTAFALAGWNIHYDTYAAAVAIKSICRNDMMCEVRKSTDNALILMYTERRSIYVTKTEGSVFYSG